MLGAPQKTSQKDVLSMPQKVQTQALRDAGSNLRSSSYCLWDVGMSLPMPEPQFPHLWTRGETGRSENTDQS